MAESQRYNNLDLAKPHTENITKLCNVSGIFCSQSPGRYNSETYQVMKTAPCRHSDKSAPIHRENVEKGNNSKLLADTYSGGGGGGGSGGIGRVVRWCWVSFQCRGDLLIWIRVRQGPIALAVVRVGVVWTFLLSSTIFSFLSPSLWETA